MRQVAVGRRALLRAAAAAVAVATAAAKPVRRQTLRLLPRIAIDPGHGGLDPGAISPGGLYEKNITLATARDLALLLLATGRYRVVMTRQGDEFVPLAERVDRARRAHADLFLSIHADALPDAAKRGALVFTLSRQASDREAAALAVSENRGADIVAGVDLARQPRDVGDVLFDLARRRTDNLSLAFAHCLVAALGATTPLLDRPQRSAGFIVLTAPDIPSALVELGCVSNPQDERLLRQPAYLWRLAHGLLLGIEAYFAAHPAAP
jgi:N-acetylmuramoyl-L-alanine amidase